MHFLGMWAPLIWNFSLHMVEYKSLRENSTSILEREIKPYRVYKKANERILEANLEGQGW